MCRPDGRQQIVLGAVNSGLLGIGGCEQARKIWMMSQKDDAGWQGGKRWDVRRGDDQEMRAQEKQVPAGLVTAGDPWITISPARSGRPCGR